jgi:DNA-binding IclR family transcriptional regulator
MATDSTEKKLRDALGRLVAGTAVRTDGRLTVSGLAREAEVSRATAHRYPAVLEDLDAASQRPAFAAVAPDGGAGLADRNARLAAENTLLRAEKEAMANAIYVLTEPKVLPTRTGQNNP